MAIFYKKETLTKSISVMALMAAINIILSLTAAFIPFLSVVLVIFLPLTSALIEVTCKDKYFPIYAFGTIGLSFAVTFWNFDFTLFYLIPSIITGYLFGLMAKKQLPTIWAVLCATIAQTMLYWLFVPIMELLTERNFIDDLAALLGLTGWSSFYDYVGLIFFGISLVQTVLSYIAVHAELKKLYFDEKQPWDFDVFTEHFSFVPIILSIIFVFIYKGISYLFVGISFVFVFFIVVKFAHSKEWLKLILAGIALFLNIFFFAIFYSLIPCGQLVLLEFAPLLITLITFLKINKEN